MVNVLLPKRIIDTEFTKKENKRVVIQFRPGRPPRRYIVGRNGFSLISYPKYLWDKFHPQDPVLDDESIHHQDLNTLNDDIKNLVKLSKARHEHIHARLRYERKIANHRATGSLFGPGV